MMILLSIICFVFAGFMYAVARSNEKLREENRMLRFKNLTEEIRADQRNMMIKSNNEID